MRPHWWREHPQTCTCVDCNDTRLRQIGGARKNPGDKNRKRRGRGNANSQPQPDEVLNPKPAQVDLAWLTGVEETPAQMDPSSNEELARPLAPPLHTHGRSRAAQRYKSRGGRCRRGRTSLAAAVLSILAGAAVGMFLGVFLLPEGAADVVTDVQQWVGGQLG